MGLDGLEERRVEVLGFGHDINTISFKKQGPSIYSQDVNTLEAGIFIIMLHSVFPVPPGLTDK